VKSDGDEDEDYLIEDFYEDDLQDQTAKHNAEEDYDLDYS